MGDVPEAMKWPRSYATYSAGDLAQISGLTQDMQRLWRKRGHLPEIGGGHARFTPNDVIMITIRYALSKLGVSPSQSPAIADIAIAGALFHAIISHAGACEVIGPAGDVDEFLSGFELDDFASDLAGHPQQTNYLVWDEDGDHRVIDRDEAIFDESTIFIAGVDLRVVGARLMIRGRKPIVTLEAPVNLTGRRVRRLTGVGANDS
ncbi:MAG: MerR family transcriptional regulator [Candidatus Sphingomonas colombiensis]|nr:MerR family transcriptional regulator [Sphingomonas sp.]WEK44901.1 MAG: MerR family transcriptional regulator [Sphingomonas sp.]